MAGRGKFGDDGIGEAASGLLDAAQGGQGAVFRAGIFAGGIWIGAGHSRQSGALMADDVLHDRFGVEKLVVDDDGCAGHKVCVQDRQAEAIVERQDQQCPVGGGESEAGHDVAGIALDIAVRDHDALRFAG